MSFIAKYRGTCADDCGEPIRPGDEVAYRGEGEDRELMHTRCPISAVGLEEALPCGECWLIHPVGACDL